MTPQNTDSIEQCINENRKMGSLSGIIMLHDFAGICKVCHEHLCRLHYNHFHFTAEGNHGRGERWYYCDCTCGHGTITGWYRTKNEAIDAWNKGIKLNKDTAQVEGRTDV